MKSLIYILGICCLLSCSNAKQSLYSYEGSKQIEIDSNMVTILKNKEDFILSCLEQHPDINIDSNINTDKLFASEKDTFDGEGREVIKRSSKIIDFISVNENEKFTATLMVCLDNEGNSVITKTLKTSRKISLKEQRLFEERLINYKYEPANNSSCLSCGLFTFNIERFNRIR